MRHIFSSDCQVLCMNHIVLLIPLFPHMQKHLQRKISDFPPSPAITMNMSSIHAS